MQSFRKCSKTLAASFPACRRQLLCSLAHLAELKSCSTRRELLWGRRVHAKAVANGHGSNLYVATALINMYAKCSSMVDARQMFDSIHRPNVVAWTALISGYAENGEGHVALQMYSKMKACGCVPNFITHIAVSKACTSLAVNGDKVQGLQMGRSLHLETAHCLCLYVQNTLIDMYAKCGSMSEARRLFDSIEQPDVVSWNALLLGYAENGEGSVAIDLFFKMKADGYAPDSVTYVAALRACTSLALNGDKARGLELGRNVHLELGGHADDYVQNTLIDMYAKCGSMPDAHWVFERIYKPDVVSWTALVLGYAENGQGYVAVDLFSKMKASGCEPDSKAYVAVLKACTSLLVNGDKPKAYCLKLGSEIHREIGDYLDSYVQNTLIDMYAKCGSMGDAHRVFDSLQKPTVVSWTALLLGYAENGQEHVSLELFSKMKCHGCVPNSVTYVAALKACGSIGALALGRKFHADVSEFTDHVVTCLVDFYAKCASMVDARAVFDLHPEAKVVKTWNALLAGYSSCRDSRSVFELFEAMQDTGFRPDAVTFLSILSCCSHVGLVRKASEYLEAMPVRYGVIPDVSHYNCMADVIGRANQLSEALLLLQRMPCNPNAVTWSSLLGACDRWKNVVIGRLAFESLMEIDRRDASAFVVMANIYGSRGMWEEQTRLLRTLHLERPPGQAHVAGVKKMYSDAYGFGPQAEAVSMS